MDHVKKKKNLLQVFFALLEKKCVWCWKQHYNTTQIFSNSSVLRRFEFAEVHIIWDKTEVSKRSHSSYWKDWPWKPQTHGQAAWRPNCWSLCHAEQFGRIDYTPRTRETENQKRTKGEWKRRECRSKKGSKIRLQWFIRTTREYNKARRFNYISMDEPKLKTRHPWFRWLADHQQDKNSPWMMSCETF